MKLNYQVVYFALFFIAPAVLAYFTSSNIYVIPLVYVFWLLLAVSLATVIIFQWQMFSADKYSARLLHSAAGARVISFVVSYNEDVRMLTRTLIAVKKANIYGETWLLDDSTDQHTVADLTEICDRLGIRFVHRDNRRGYKAGAINDALKQIDDSYEFLAVFDSDQRPTPKFFNGVISYFDRKMVAVVQMPQIYMLPFRQRSANQPSSSRRFSLGRS